MAIALDGAGVEFHDLTLRPTTLDDVFLELTGTHIQPTRHTANANTAQETR